MGKLAPALKQPHHVCLPNSRNAFRFVWLVHSSGEVISVAWQQVNATKCDKRYCTRTDKVWEMPRSKSSALFGQSRKESGSNTWEKSWMMNICQAAHGGALLLPVTKSCPLFVIPWTVAARLLCPWGFSRQEYWSGLPFPSPGESSQIRDQTCISCLGRQILYHWTTREAHFSCFLRLILVINRCLFNYVLGSTKLMFGSLCSLASLFQDPTIKFFVAIKSWWTHQVVVPPPLNICQLSIC